LIYYHYDQLIRYIADVEARFSKDTGSSRWRSRSKNSALVRKAALGEWNWFNNIRNRREWLERVRFD